METKVVHIKKDEKTIQDIKAYRENKKAFREAARQGKALEYIRANAQQFSQPV